jgi:TM2 domain-containing membrane protein YozV
MRQAITAIFLSALVFPGLGQLYNQDRRKGIFLVLAANLLAGLLLLVGLALFSQAYHATFYPAPLTMAVFKQLVKMVFTHPLFLVPFCLLVGLWAFGVVDAARSALSRRPAGG